MNVHPPLGQAGIPWPVRHAAQAGTVPIDLACLGVEGTLLTGFILQSHEPAFLHRFAAIAAVLLRRGGILLSCSSGSLRQGVVGAAVFRLAHLVQQARRALVGRNGLGWRVLDDCKNTPPNVRAPCPAQHSMGCYCGTGGGWIHSGLSVKTLDVV